LREPVPSWDLLFLCNNIAYWFVLKGMVAAETSKPAGLDFETIYKTHYRRVLNLCRYLLNSPDAEDAAHEAFLRAHGKLESYDPSLPLSSWLMRIASNYCIDLLRRKGTERRIFDLDPGETFDPPSGASSPLSEVLIAERGKDVRAALAKLSDKYRIPLVLAFYNELDYEEISSVIGVGRTQVAMLIFRGKQQLRQRLGKERTT
jgi:RNA polymerase sigma-70 factor (ECF subfamily)